MKALEKGIIKEFTIHASKLGRDKTIWVYLPFNYKESGINYPVIYMHDGQNVFNKSDVPKHHWFAEDKLNEAQAGAIVVAIEHGGSVHRIDELTPYKNKEHGGGHADDYLDFIINELKPYVDRNFPTNADAKNTTIFGSSVGGLVAFYALIKFPEIFGNAGVFSPSFWFSEEIFKLVVGVPVISGRIYLMAGDHESKEMIQDIERMEQLLLYRMDDKNKLYKKIVHGGHHNEKLWRHEFKDAFKWFLNNN